MSVEERVRLFRQAIIDAENAYGVNLKPVLKTREVIDSVTNLPTLMVELQIIYSVGQNVDSSNIPNNSNN